MNAIQHHVSYDIEPQGVDIFQRDTLSNFPAGHKVCVTNPPWLAKNSATARRLPYPDTKYDNIYKLAIEKCLSNCDWVAMLLPETFIRSGIFRPRLTDIISLADDVFSDTDQPTCLSLFQPGTASNTRLWLGDREIGQLAELEFSRPAPDPAGPLLKFNDTDGHIGLIAVDNCRTESIRFCHGEEISSLIKYSSRHSTRISGDIAPQIDVWNEILSDFRTTTQDLLLAAFKGRRKDGKYRRRCDWKLARGIIHMT